jgi:arylsulfatase
LPGPVHIDRFAVPDIRNRSHQISASFSRQSTQQQGTLVACGARTGGYALYVLNNRLVYEYNYVGRSTVVTSDTELPDGPCEVSMRFEKRGEHVGEVILTINGDAVGCGDLELLPWRQSLFGMDVGADTGSPVSAAYGAPFQFEGDLNWVDYALKNDRDDLIKAATIEGRNALTDQ